MSTSPLKDDWIDRFLEKTLDEEAAGKLLDELKSSAAFRACFFEQLDVHYFLRYLALAEAHCPTTGLFSEKPVDACPTKEDLRRLLDRYERGRSLPDNAPPLFDENLLEQIRRLPPIVPSVATAPESVPSADPAPKPLKVAAAPPKTAGSNLLPIAILLVALLLYIPLVFHEFNSPPAETSRTRHVPAPIATLTDLADVRWTDGKNNAYEPGQPLYSNRLDFTEGTVELLFYNGVHCIIEGPADIVLIDKKQVLCRRGNWSVTVPRQGSGFEIQTPRNVIRDLGTQFYAGIDRESVRVQVLQGLVEFEESGRQTVRLRDRQAIGVREDGTREQGVFQWDRFVSRLEMRRRSDLFLKSNRVFQAASRGEKNPIYRFDLNATPSPTGIRGGERVEGRSPGRRALRFVDNSDRVRLPTSGSTDSLSAVAWIRVDRLRSGHNPILMSSGMERGGLAWQISERGTLILGWRNRKGQSVDWVESPVVLTEETLGQWIQLAFVIDRPQRSVSLFMNGLPLLCDAAPRLPKFSLADLDLGNWQTTAREKSTFKPLVGAVDELLLFDVPLTPYEIRAAYGAIPAE